MEKIIICKECNKEFIFSEKEQEFFGKKEFPDPIRCKLCREKRKNERIKRELLEENLKEIRQINKHWNIRENCCAGMDC